MTSHPNLALMIYHADCQASIFYDPTHHAVAAVHAGWKGLVKEIYRKTIQSMKKRYGTKPEDLLVAISPSLGPNASEFVNYLKEFPRSFWNYQIKPNYFDLWEIAKMQLANNGIYEKNIQIAGLCTYSNPEDFFSYRRDKTACRHATIVSLD